jgi:hypothetical protein
MNSRFSISKFVVLRPYLYHLTFPENFIEIQSTQQLERANTLIDRAGKSELSRARRLGHSKIFIEDRPLYLRDQFPLHRGPIAYATGWSYEDVLYYLNDHVFFWPGDATGPIPSGQRHFRRYSSEKHYVIRARTSDLLSANVNLEPLFSRCNSGAPRCSYGQKAPRGPETFNTAEKFQSTPSNVVEVTFRAAVKLPRTAEAAVSSLEVWKPLEQL